MVKRAGNEYQPQNPASYERIQNALDQHVTQSRTKVKALPEAQRDAAIVTAQADGIKALASHTLGKAVPYPDLTQHLTLFLNNFRDVRDDTSTRDGILVSNIKKLVYNDNRDPGTRGQEMLLLANHANHRDSSAGEVAKALEASFKE